MDHCPICKQEINLKDLNTTLAIYLNISLLVVSIPTIIHPGQTRPIFFVYLNISLLVVSIPTR
jgi:hypothetical protein